MPRYVKDIFLPLDFWSEDNCKEQRVALPMQDKKRAEEENKAQVNEDNKPEDVEDDYGDGDIGKLTKICLLLLVSVCCPMKHLKKKQKS